MPGVYDLRLIQFGHVVCCIGRRGRTRVHYQPRVQISTALPLLPDERSLLRVVALMTSVLTVVGVLTILPVKVVVRGDVRHLYVRRLALVSRDVLVVDLLLAVEHLLLGVQVSVDGIDLHVDVVAEWVVTVKRYQLPLALRLARTVNRVPQGFCWLLIRGILLLLLIVGRL